MLHMSSMFVCLVSFALAVYAGGCSKSDRDESRDAPSNIRHLFKPELPFKEKEFKENAIAFERNEATALTEEGGVVEIQDDLTVDSCMYITKSHSYGNLYLFIVWRGKGSNLRGYIYRIAAGAEPLDADVIEVFGPIVGEVGQHVGKIDVDIEPMSIPGWYKVSRSLD